MVSRLQVTEEPGAIDDEDPPVPGEAPDILAHDGGNTGVDHCYPGIPVFEFPDHLLQAGFRAEDDLVLNEEGPVDRDPDEGRGVEVTSARTVDDDGEVFKTRQTGDRPGHCAGPERVFARGMRIVRHLQDYGSAGI